MIRYCAPAQWFARTAHKDVQVAGADIRKGQRIIVLFGSAGRDEAEFDRPDEFIWNRRIERVLSFGTGQHYCIGIHLARLELQIMVAAFLRRVAAFSFDMGKALRLPIRILQRNADAVLVEVALEPGDLVVTEGVQSLRPGAEVQVQPGPRS